MATNEPPYTPGRFKEAVDWYRARVPFTKEEWLKLSEGARRRASTIAGVAQVDVIGDVMKDLEKALTKGETLEDFRARAKEKLVKAWGGEIPGRIECLPGDNVVTGAVVRAGHRRWFQGHIVEVVTEGGRDFTATANHPMLTVGGWRGAGQLRPGDYLVSYDGQQDARARGNAHEAHAPASIAQVYEAAAQAAWRQRVACGQFDFHGDVTQGQVDVVSPFDDLPFGAFATLTKPLEQHVFPEARLAQSLAPRFCRSCLHLAIWSQRCGFCDAPMGDAHALQSQDDDAMADVEFLRQGIRAFASQVAAGDVRHRQAVMLNRWAAAPREMVQAGGAKVAARACVAHDIEDPACRYAPALGYLRPAQAVAIKADRVVAVRLRPFRGHVFNLSTPFGYFYLNGLVTGNTIFRTNAQAAYSHGRRAQMVTPAMLRIRPYWRFVALLDARTTTICRPLNGVTLPATDPFWNTRQPPLHFQCRSLIQSLRKSVAEEEGITEEVPDVQPMEGFGSADPLTFTPDITKHPKDLQKAYKKKEGDPKKAKQPPPLPEPVEPPPAFAGPDGARYAKQFPELAKLYGERLHVEDSKHAHAQLAELAALPASIHEQVAAAGTRIFIGPGHSGDFKKKAQDIANFVAGAAHTSRPASAIGGVYVRPQGDPKKGFLIIGTHQYVGVGPARWQMDVQAVGVARHEYGHAYDFTAHTPVSKDQQFKDAWRAMYMHETAQPLGQRYVDQYFLQSAERESNNPNWTVGTTETFAESFRVYWEAGGGEKGRDAVANKFTQRIADRFHELMKGHQ